MWVEVYVINWAVLVEKDMLKEIDDVSWTVSIESSWIV